MDEYNAKQQACIDEWNGVDSEYCDGGIITEFLKEFNKIPAGPDTYCILKKTEWVGEVVEENLTLDEATNTLTIQMTQTFASSVIEYLKGSHLKTLSGAVYTIKKED